MKALVTGGSGLLGGKLINELLGAGNEVIAIYNRNPITIEHKRLTKVKLDITDTTRLEDLILRTRPDVIVHAAAYTDVDGCEKNKEYAWKVNVEATRSVMRASRVVRSYLIYISTDYVFDGSKGLYREDDVPDPINYYGLTKLIGEELVKASDLLYSIIRPSAIYGIGGSKKSFAEFVAERLSKGERVYALTDQYVSPTYNLMLAKAIAEIIDLRPMGTLHVAGERMSRYEFALRIARILGLPEDLVEKAKIEDMKGWAAKRPRDSSLNVERAKNILKIKFYDVDLSLRLFKDEWVKLNAI